MKIFLTKEQVQELVSKNKYPVDPEEKFLSRCIDDRYQEDKSINPLSTPGGDAGELALITATANTYGFEADLGKVFDCLVELIGGVKNFSFHTDKKHVKFPVAGYGYFRQMEADPATYNLKKEQLEAIKKKLDFVLDAVGEETVLVGEHSAGALVIIHGKYNILPCYVIESDFGKERVEFFTYHQTLVDERHKKLCKLLVEKKAVKLLDGCDADYLYQVMSETAENQLMETARRLAKGLPIYKVNFQDDGSFVVEEMGKA